MSAALIDSVTVLILTYNEAANIDRTLAALRRFRRVIVVDSGSDDGTLEIIARHPNAEIVYRAFDNFAEQCNFGLAHPHMDTEWVLSLDADYLLDDDFVEELARLSPRDELGGYRAHFRYCVFGRAIRSGIYPPVVVLFRRQGAHFMQDGHAHRVAVAGFVEDLSGRIHHDDRKPLVRWLRSQMTYAEREADHLENHDRSTLRWQDRIRLIVVIAPLAMFNYVYWARGGFLDGWRGFYYALQRTYAELLLSLALLDRKLRRIADL
jgi:glycosyltransferase involved in cell wall biosynthesis